MTDQGESSGSSRSSKRLCKRKYFTTADVLATNVDSSDESNNESDFFLEIERLTKNKMI